MSEPLEVTYTIAAVSKLTGVSCHALRVWERRYGFPVPSRSATGHRRYSREQVDVIRRLSELTRAGRTIGDLIASYRNGRLPLEAPRPSDVAAGGETEAGDFLDRMLAGDLTAAEAAFSRLADRLDEIELINRVIEPALVEAGDRWFRRECSIVQEHMITAYLRSKLNLMIERARRGNPRPSHSIVVGTVQGDRHEGGVLILNYVLERHGWRVLNVSVDQPVAELHAAVKTWRPDALALSFVLSRNINKRFQELARIREVPVFVGGRSILNYQRLARRYGLIPVTGAINHSVAALHEEFAEWAKSRGQPSPSGS